LVGHGASCSAKSRSSKSVRAIAPPTASLVEGPTFEAARGAHRDGQARSPSLILNLPPCVCNREPHKKAHLPDEATTRPHRPEPCDLDRGGRHGRPVAMGGRAALRRAPARARRT